MTGLRTTLPGARNAAKTSKRAASVRHRTGARWLSTSYTYELRGREGFVYFVQDADNRDSLIKIGFSEDPDVRLRLIQRGHDEPLVILAAFVAVMGEEAGLHKHFADAREHGEWFRAVPELLDLIAEVDELTWHEHMAARGATQ